MLKKNKKINYQNLLIEWLESIKLKVKATTFIHYQQLIYQHIIPILGIYKVEELTTKQIEQFLKFKLENGRLDKKGGLSIKTTTDLLILIKTTLQYAKNQQLKMKCNLNLLKIKKQEKKVKIFSRKEQMILENNLINNINKYKLGIIISLYTGIRIGELCALKWSNIDFQNQKIYINQTVQRIKNFETSTNLKTKIMFSSPKSYSSIREIPIPKILIPFLKKYYQNSNLYVLSCKEKQIEPRVMQYQFKKQLKQCNLPLTFSFHSLRHTFATRCVEMGFEIKSLSEILGHSNVNITLDCYVHSSFELKMIQMNKLKLLNQ